MGGSVVATFLVLAALHDLGFAVFHLRIPVMFDWRHGMASLKPADIDLIQVMNLSLSALFTVGGVLALLALGHGRDEGLSAALAGYGFFWWLRAALQPIYWGINTRFSQTLFALFLAGAAVHTGAALLP
jgi:hypothetical protein